MLPAAERRPAMDEREMYEQITALVGAVGAALDMVGNEVVVAIEEGRLGMETLTDAEGGHFIRATCDGRQADITMADIMRVAGEQIAEHHHDHHHDHACGCGHDHDH
jgi:ABC-type nickel/cobalt efflux system permease component RcnA